MNIILDSPLVNGIAFNLAHLQHYLAQISDPRQNRGKIYPLPLLLTYILLAKLAGCDKPTSIFQWVRQHQTELLSLSDTRHQRVPCLNTYRNIMNAGLGMDALMTAFNQYLLSTYGGQQSRLIVIDGKTLCGTIPKGETAGTHLLAAYLPEEGVVLRQIEVDSKENEITAAHGLLEEIPLKDRVVCGDAMHTQRQLSVEILAQGGDYLWFVKENQPSLCFDVTQFFKPPRKAAGWHHQELPYDVAQETNKGHGRLETRRLTLIEDTEAFLSWPGVKQVFMLERDVTQLKRGHHTHEIAYGITSCDRESASAEQLLAWTRQYWGIENGLHYRRDVTLREDDTRMSMAHMPAIMATINNFIVGLTQKLGFSNLAHARRVFAYHISAQLMA